MDGKHDSLCANPLARSRGQKLDSEVKIMKEFFEKIEKISKFGQAGEKKFWQRL
jgi:hypothetical protein